MRKSAEITYWTTVGLCFLSSIAGKILKESSTELGTSVDPIIIDSMQYGGAFMSLALLFIRGIATRIWTETCTNIGSNRNSFHNQNDQTDDNTATVSNNNSTYGTTSVK